MAKGLYTKDRRAKAKERVFAGELSLQQYLDEAYDNKKQEDN